MKRFLSLLLALLLCVSFIVSCEKEETPSSSSSESFSTSSLNESSTSGQQSSIKENEKSDDEILDEYNFVIPDFAYETFNVNLKEGVSHEAFEQHIFNDYQELLYFLESETTFIGDSNITESVFEDCFVIAISRNDDIRKTKRYFYYGFEKTNDQYMLRLKYALIEGKEYPQEAYSKSVDLVLVPRNKCAESDPRQIELSLRREMIYVGDDMMFN